jgi:cysteinyl-tRNA synthetase
MAAQTVGGQGQVLDVSALRYEFDEAMRNDLDTPTALRLLTAMATQISATAATGWHVAAAQTTLGQVGQIFGLQLGQAAPEKRVVAGWQQHLLRFT